MVATTDIKYFVFDNYNAPQLTNDYGSMIRVLDVCLINGITLPQVSSLTINANVATLTFNSAHLLKQYQIIEISGANESIFNTQHRILTVSSNSLTFKIITNLTQATGVLAAKLPALGWEKPFSSTSATGGKAAYRSKNTLLPSRPFLRVVDELDPSWTSTYAKYAKVGIVEDMTSIDIMLGVQAPFSSSESDKNWVGTGSGTTAYNGWARWYYARNSDSGVSGNQYDYSAPSNGMRKWMLVGNTDFFYILPAVGLVQQNLTLYGFGAFERLSLTDNFNTFLACSDYYNKANDSQQPAIGSGVHASGSSNNKYSNLLVQRKYDGTQVYNNARCGGLYSVNAGTYSGSQNYLTSFNNEYIAAPVYLFDYFAYGGIQLVARGKMPLVNWLFNTSPYSDLQFFFKNSSLFMAKSIAVAGDVMGQILFDFGEI